MNFQELHHFITHRMRMSHVYQPVMIGTLLKAGGTAPVEEIARSLLDKDRSQIEYYIEITNHMVGKVLRNHGVVVKEGKEYRLPGAQRFTRAQRELLLDACEQRLAEYIDKRGNRIWLHRYLDDRFLPGSLRYEVLKAAKFRCELCGTPADEKALDVDHIIPRSKGGKTERANLQALCYTCNRAKRDSDDTDFRAMKTLFDTRLPGCSYCSTHAVSPELENSLSLAFPNTEASGRPQYLVVPRRHVENFFDLGTAEVRACWDLVGVVRKAMLAADKSIGVLNVGIAQTEQSHGGHCSIRVDAH